MKTCPKCNMSGLPDDAKFCPKCGTKFDNGKGKRSLKVLLIIFLIGGVIAGFVSYIYHQAQVAHEKYILNTPSGFVVDDREEWGLQDYYQTRDEDRSQSTLFYYVWEYSKFVYVNFYIDENIVTGKLTGYINYNDQPSNIHHDYKLKGIAEGGAWKFEILDGEGNIIDFYEVHKVLHTLYGTCTNLKDTKIKLKAKQENTFNAEYF